MTKQQLLLMYTTPEDFNKKYFSPRPTKKIGLLSDIKFGVEIEFPYDEKNHEELMYNFNIYNKQELGGKWQIDFEIANEYPPNVKIGEFISPILHDDIDTLDQLNVILQLVQAFEHPILGAKDRNMHFHFDMSILGDSLEHLPQFLKVFRAYENIFFRTLASETGQIKKDGISNKIAEVLKENSISSILKKYNGGDYNLENLKKYRKLPINLFNIGSFYESNKKNASPGIINKKSDNILEQIQTSKFVLDTNPYLNDKRYNICKTLTPTLEMRLTPSTHDLGFLQQHLLLYSAMLAMSIDMETLPGLKEKIDYRNELIDKNGPQIYDVDFDEGISDIIYWLPQNLARRILLQYTYSKPISLYCEKVKNRKNQDFSF